MQLYVIFFFPYTTGYYNFSMCIGTFVSMQIEIRVLLSIKRVKENMND